jgi:hypothetical protein
MYAFSTIVHALTNPPATSATEVHERMPHGGPGQMTGLAFSLTHWSSREPSSDFSNGSPQAREFGGESKYTQSLDYMMFDMMNGR